MGLASVTVGSGHVVRLPSLRHRQRDAEKQSKVGRRRNANLRISSLITREFRLPARLGTHLTLVLVLLMKGVSFASIGM